MQKINNNKTVVVALSGGVDSSVVALLLKKQGYNVVGLHMRDGDSPEKIQDEQIVRDLCKKLNIQCEIVEFKNEMQLVKDYFIAEYKKGRTPNPCVICNREVKFKPFLDFAEKYNAEFYATGHYVCIEHDGDKHILKKALDKNKDQSYFLNQVESYKLKKALFPLGNLSKDEVRSIAEKNDLITAHKKDSYDVCFIGSKKFKDFMNKNFPEKAGKIIEVKTGKIVGRHDGISKYTIGQRKGLGIGGLAGGSGEGWFVINKDIDKNILYVAQGDGDELLSSGLVADSMNWLTDIYKIKEFECYAKFRYRQEDQGVKVEVLSKDKINVVFKDKQRAITVGQYVVLYDKDGCLLGGGIIQEVKR